MTRQLHLHGGAVTFWANTLSPLSLLTLLAFLALSGARSSRDGQPAEGCTEPRNPDLSAPSQNCSGGAHLEAAERREDDAWWQAWCLESLKADPWHLSEVNQDGQGYVIMKPDKRRRRLAWQQATPVARRAGR